MTWKKKLLFSLLFLVSVCSAGLIDLVCMGSVIKKGPLPFETFELIAISLVVCQLSTFINGIVLGMMTVVKKD